MPRPKSEQVPACLPACFHPSTTPCSFHPLIPQAGWKSCRVVQATRCVPPRQPAFGPEINEERESEMRKCRPSRSNPLTPNITQWTIGARAAS